MTKGWTLRRFNHSDIQRVAEFRKSFPISPLVKCEEPEYHKWKCCSNPVQEGYIWLAEDGDRIVSTASMTPKRMKIMGREVLAAETGDTFTLPEYQGRGIFTSLVKSTTAEAVKKGVNFIYGLPNNDSLPGYINKLDYGQITSPALWYLGWPLNIKKILKQKTKSSLLASVLSLPLKIISAAVFKLATMKVGGTDISVSQVSSFPEDIVKLWERVSSNYDIMLVRDKKYLDWRYVAAPNRDSYLKLIARSREGEVLGYMIGRVSEMDDRMCGFMVDFLTLEDNTRVFKKLVLALFEVFRKEEVDIMSAWTMKGSFYYKTLVRLGFLPWTKILLICYKNELGDKILNNAYKWHFTQGDSDGI